MSLAQAAAAGHGGQREHLHRHARVRARAQAQLLDPARDLVQVFLQCGQQNSRLAAAGKVGGYILGAKAHGFQLFDLQNAGHVVVVVIAASAVRRGVGGRQQTLFL